MKIVETNTTTYGTVIEADMLRKAYEWAETANPGEGVLVQFRYIFNEYGMGSAVLGKVVIDNELVGEYSTTGSPTLEEILEARACGIELRNPCDGTPSTFPSQKLSYFDVGYIDNDYVEPNYDN